jgi:hypothetical protein
LRFVPARKGCLDVSVGSDKGVVSCNSRPRVTEMLHKKQFTKRLAIKQFWIIALQPRRARTL